MRNIANVLVEIMTQPFFHGFWAVFIFFSVLGLAFYLVSFRNDG